MSLVRAYHLIYPLDGPNRVRRDRSMKVLALGLPRTGTESLRSALEELGYDYVYHGWDTLEHLDDNVTWSDLMHLKNTGQSELLDAKAFDAVLGHCEAVADAPPATFAAELIKAYPEAKIIINYRESIEDWYRSYMTSHAQANSSKFTHFVAWFHPKTFWVRRMYVLTQVNGLFKGDPGRYGKQAYREHYAMLETVAPPERTLKWTVKDGWEPLCRLLDKPVPNKPFPAQNAQDAFMKRTMGHVYRTGQLAFINMLLVFGVLFAGLAMIWMYWIR